MLVLQAGIVRKNHEIPDYRILRDLLRVQRRNDAVGVWNHISSLSHELEHTAHLVELGLLDHALEVLDVVPGLICLLSGLHGVHGVLLLSLSIWSVNSVLIYILLELHLKLLLLPLLLLLLMLERGVRVLLDLLGVALLHGVHMLMLSWLRLLNWNVLDGILLNVSSVRMDIFLAGQGLHGRLLLDGIPMNQARNLLGLLSRMLLFFIK